MLELDLGSASTDAMPGGQAWAGLAADPFAADGAALAGFLEAASDGRYAPELFDDGNNVFEGRDVTAVALQVPDVLFGSSRASVWALVTLTGHAEQRRVSRMGQPMLRPLFFPVPGPDTEGLNAGDPGTDRERYSEHLMTTASLLADVAGVPDAEHHSAAVADSFLPDVLGYRAGEPAGCLPGRGNGRGLGATHSPPPCSGHRTAPRHPHTARRPGRYVPARGTAAPGRAPPPAR